MSRRVTIQTQNQLIDLDLNFAWGLQAAHERLTLSAGGTLFTLYENGDPRGPQAAMSEAHQSIQQAKEGDTVDLQPLFDRMDAEYTDIFYEE